jgi:phage terminase small subunit
MGKRGPRPDPAQAAKGFPGRRKAKAEAAAGEAAKVAGILAPVDAAKADLPEMLRAERFAPAAAVWRKLAAELKRTHRLPVESEFFFVQLCIYAQEWTDATEDLHQVGFTQTVDTVAGGKMERRRPKTLDRQEAYRNCLDLSARFGLTPHDVYSLFKGQAAVAATNPGLFDPDRKGEPDPAPAAVTSRIGSLARMRSEPPDVRPN